MEPGGQLGAVVAVELWRAELDAVDPALLAAFAETLSDEERVRADALRDPVASRRFVADHGWRRRVLAARTGRAPAEIAYVTGTDGKPALHPAGPRFNASRAEATALYAVCDEAEVGVDVEAVEADDDERLAGRLLGPSEQLAFETLEPAARPQALAACWTRKEAYLKALGTGLVFPLTELELWPGDDRGVRHDDVVVHAVSVASGLAGAVAVRLEPGQVTHVPAVARDLAEALR